MLAEHFSFGEIKLLDFHEVFRLQAKSKLAMKIITKFLHTPQKTNTS